MGGLGRIVATLALLAGMAGGAMAQDLKGMAIAQASDDAFQACHGTSVEATLNCARSKCQSEGGANCLRVRWCYPAEHSGAMSYLENRALTKTAFLCGAPTEAALLRMLAALCNANPAASECRLMVVWTPDGTENARTDLLGKNTAD